MRTEDPLAFLLPEFRAYALTISGSQEVAEDLVQDAVTRALGAERRPCRPEELRPWMFRVIRNLHTDELRKRRVRREYLSEATRLLDERSHGGDRERDLLVRLAFERLPPPAREVLFLIDVMGFKYIEAAEVIGVPPGTMMSRVSRARKALMQLVDGGEESDVNVSHRR